MIEEKINFIKLSIEEVLPKLVLLAKQKEIIKIWEPRSETYHYRLKDYTSLKSDDSSDFYLTLFSEGEEQDQELIGKKVYYSFFLNESDYFSEGTISYDEAHNTLVVRLTEKIYRTEKRDSERLLTFPHHQVYVYFKVLNEKAESNVIEIHREEDRLYQDYKNKQKKELKEKLRKKVSDVEDLIGFRALDISKSGIAFILGEEESRYFKEDRKYSFYILFDSDIFMVRGADMVYKVDYLGDVKEKKRFKIGLTFVQVENLSGHIDKLLRENVEDSSLQKEFEDFLDE